MTQKRRGKSLPGLESDPATAAAPDAGAVAIVGIGCRLPGGADDPESFWRLLAEGREAVTTVPPDRWDADALHHPDPAHAGRISARRGGFLGDGEIDRFDAAFFGISPREAARLDPQHRLLLEATYRACEDAGVPVESLAGSRTAVFVGISTHDYADLQGLPSERLLVGAHTNTGGALSIAANRLSYTFDLRGPSMAVDTACSSSLVALHLACQSLARGEASAAFVGGVNAILKPEIHIGFSRGGFLSPEGRCHAFDARADGYVRSEGVAVVLLKPLDRALADGDRVYAVVRATVTNQDGRTAGLALPSEAAQVALLEEAYREAGVDPAEVAYVEAHGTGTPAGDPVEARALGRALGGARRGSGRPPLLVGSVKTNLGHLEAGSGVAGLVKLALAMDRRALPASLHFERPNPAIAFDELGIRVVTALEPWPAERRFAGINSFGFGGANAHAVLELAPPARARGAAQDAAAPAAPRDGRGRPFLLLASARSEAALAEVVGGYRATAAAIAGTDELAELCAASRVRASHHPLRLAVLGADAAALAAALGTCLDETERSQPVDRCVWRGRADARRERGIGAVFSGQGGQWWGMGRGLLRDEPLFADWIALIDGLFRPLGGWSLVDQMTCPEPESRVDDTEVAQPLMFALEVALYEWLRACGLRPAVVLGHSVGEVAAAYAAGALTLPQAVEVVFHRSRLQQQTTDQGGMIAAVLSEEQAATALAPWRGRLEIAAVNGPQAVTLAGDVEAIAAFEDAMAARGVPCTRLRVRVPFHSRYMDPLADALLAALGGLRPTGAGSGAAGAATAPTIPMISTVTAAPIGSRPLDARYWWDNMRAPVHLHGALRAAIAMGVEDFIEIGPHPVHAAAIRATFEERAGHVVTTLRRGEDEARSLCAAAAGLHVAGHRVDWEMWGRPRTAVRPPPYPFQRERFWCETTAGGEARRRGLRHPFLGAALPPASPEIAACFALRIDRHAHPYLDDHRIQGPIVFPGAGLVEILVAAARAAFPDQPCELGDVVFETMLFVPDDGEAPQAHVTIHDDGEMGIWSQDRDGAPVRHLRGRLARGAPTAPRPLAREQWERRPLADLDVDTIFREVGRAGLALGPSFRGVRRLRGCARSDGGAELVGEVNVHPSLHHDFPRYHLHPAILDACFQCGLGAGQLVRPGEAMGAYVARQVGQLLFHARPNGSLLSCYAHVKPLGDAQRVFSDIWVYDQAGTLVAEVRDFGAQYLPGSRGHGDGEPDPARLLYQDRWVESEDEEEAAVETARTTTPAPPGPRRRILLASDHPFAAALADALAGSGEDVVRIATGAPPGEAPDVEAIAAAVVAAAGGPGDPAGPAGTALTYLALPGTAAPGDDAATIAPAAAAPPPDDTAVSAALAGGPLILTAVARALGRRPSPVALPVSVVTAGAWAPEGEVPQAFLDGGLWGFARVLHNEHPHLQGVLVDVGPRPGAAELGAVVAALTRAAPREEVLARRGRRWRRRFERVGAAAGAGTTTPTPPADGAGPPAFIVERPATGILDDVKARAVERRAPGPGQVEVAVAAAALNFRDLLSATRAFSDEVLAGGYFGGGQLGGECSGRVTRTGAGVSGLEPGDRVMALAPACLASHVVADARYVVRAPAALDDDAAAALLVPYLTAWMALVELARVRAGESVLIHAAAGGVGLAAVHLARHLGARVLATGGTAEKRDFLRGCAGVERVMDSRTLAFADEVAAGTAGRGVDVVLSAQSGPARDASLRCLAPYGRFVEIGKRDLLDNRRVGLRALLENRALMVLDVNTMLSDDPDRVVAALRAVMEGIGTGALPALPTRSFPVSESAEALKLFAQARHIGKVVVRVAGEPVAVTVTREARHLISPRGTMVVSGGGRGLGLATARWLVQHGARELVLLGRSGRLDPDAVAEVETLRAAGATVRVAAVDVGDEAAVRRLFAEIGGTMSPVRGIFHAAMVLDDDALVRLDRARWETVIRPKLRGALNLHRAAAGHPVEMFVCYSSFAGLYGNPGQASYAYANSALDAFVEWRRAQGLPALAIAWGAIADTGVVARDARLADLLARQGIEPVTAREALAALERALLAEQTRVAALRLDWTRARRLGGAAAPRFAALAAGGGGSAGGGGTANADGASLAELARTDRAAALPPITGALRELVAQVVCHPADTVDTGLSLADLGFDSLMTNQLHLLVDERFGDAPSFTELMRARSLDDVAASLVDRLARAPADHSADLAAAGG